MIINEDILLPYLMYNKPVPYNENITLYPVTMNDVILFQTLQESIIVRKDSTFHEKAIIKMRYLEFLMYCAANPEIEQKYQIKDLSKYFWYAIELLNLCLKDNKVKLDPQNQHIVIEKETVSDGKTTVKQDILTNDMFDDFRRIIIIQNDIDFDIDEFLNYDTEQSLLNAQKKQNKNLDKANIEDYIDSLVIVMNTTEDRIMNMTIRKFWRYIKRYQLHENYQFLKTGECSGMVTFKEPIKHWMVSLEKDDKYGHLKADENEIKGKIG